MARAVAATALSRIVQQDLSGGMFPELAPELIPPNGAFDITNGLLNEQNVVVRRGGTNYYSSAPAGGPVRLLWSGYLKNGGLQTILCTATESFRVEPGGALHFIALAPPGALSQGTVFQGRLYVPGVNGRTHVWDGANAAEDGRASASPFYATAANRLVVGSGQRVSVSKIPAAEGEAVSWEETTNFLNLPEGVAITGMAGLRTSVVVFTSLGIWVIGGLAHKEITDSAGNIQWSQDRYSADAVLWGEPGLAAWKGGLVVPCKDDVWLMELGVTSEKHAPFRSISGPIRNLYRGYVTAGCHPGAAVVFNGHYFLPVMSGDNVIDMLVCRLEGVGPRAAPAWTHLKGYGAEIPALTSTVSDVEGPLIGATAGVARVLRLGYFTPGATVATDADGSAVPFEITTRSIPTGNLVPNTVLKARLSYRMVAGPATKIEIFFGETPYGPDWGEFAWADGSDWVAASGPFVSLGESVPPATADPEGVVPKTWRVSEKVRYARVRIVLNGPASQVSLRALELFVRPSGRIL